MSATTITSIATDIPRRSLIALLKKHVCLIVFRKVNGDIRRLKCTLKPSLIPDSETIDAGDNKESIRAWDIEKNAWRTFRLDGLRSSSKIIE